MSPTPADAPTRPTESTVTVGDVFRTWWPLAASWLLMGMELPMVSAVVARMRDPQLNLAAYGGVVFPLSLMIESPIVMMLAASTALSKDWASYRLMRRFMFTAAGLLTTVHVLLAFTPLYDIVIGGAMGVPEAVREQARVGLRLMTPWTLSIAYRRFQQGVLIRFGETRSVGVGTAVRLATNAVVLGVGHAIGVLPGIIVGAAAVALGVVAEAVYAGYRVHPVLRQRLRPSPTLTQPLTMDRFLRFYFPLMITPIIMFFAMPLTSAAMSRAHMAVESLAVWPVVMGLVFTLRSVCFGLNEVVVAMLERPGALPALRGFTWRLAAATSAGLLVTAGTPLGAFWFGRVSALSRDLVALANPGLWISFLMPGLTAFQSLYQGTLVHAHRTRGVTESVALYLLTVATVLGLGTALPRAPGVYVGLTGMLAGNVAMMAWLAFRARAVSAAAAAPAPAG